MVAAEVGDQLAGRPQDPQAERHRSPGQEVVDPVSYLAQRVLEGVRRIDPAAQSPVEVDVDKPPQPITVVGEQLLQCVPVACLDEVKKAHGLFGVWAGDSWRHFLTHEARASVITFFVILSVGTSRCEQNADGLPRLGSRDLGVLVIDPPLS
jgi:hypothetical protein